MTRPFSRPAAFQQYAIDVLVHADAAAGGSPAFAILLHPPSHYTTSRDLLGTAQLKGRILGLVGCVVIHISHEEWNELRTDIARHTALRAMLEPRIRYHQEWRKGAEAQLATASAAGGDDENEAGRR